MPLVSVQSISYNYNSESVLENVSFDVEEGDFLGIIGPNGAGKTTLFHCMLGLLNSYSGKITILNQDINKYKNKRIGQLSGGQQQRVLIAKALVNNPIILMLDEPTNELDHKSQNDFYSLLKELNEKNKITIIWSSHDMDAVNKYANKVSCINKRMFFHGDKGEFFSSEDHLKNYSESTMQIHMHSHDM